MTKGISEKEVEELKRKNSVWKRFVSIKSIFGGSKDTAGRDIATGDLVFDEWADPPSYTGKSLTKMVKDIPDIRGAITTQVNAAVGEWKFVTLTKQDKESEDPRIQQITKIVEFPERNFELLLRKMTFSLLMRGIYFLEMARDAGKEPWMYVMNPQRCKFIYNNLHTRIIGLEVANPADANAEPAKLKLEDFVYNSMDNFDGQDIPSPPLETLISDANIYQAGQTYVKNMYKSGGLGRMAFIMEEGSDDDYKAMKADIKNRKGSSVGIKGKIKIQQLSLSPTEMGYETLYDDFVEKIMTLYSVPPIMMSKPNASFKESSKSEMNAFASKIRSVQRCLQNGIDQSVLKLYGDVYGDMRFKLKPWVDAGTQAAVFEVLMRIGAITPNEVRVDLDKPLFEEEWADLPYNFNFPPQRMELELAKEQAGGGAKVQESTKQDGDEDKDPAKPKVDKYMEVFNQFTEYLDELVKQSDPYGKGSN